MVTVSLNFVPPILTRLETLKQIHRIKNPSVMNRSVLEISNDIFPTLLNFMTFFLCPNSRLGSQLTFCPKRKILFR